MHVLCRKDKLELLPDRSSGSTDVKDYRFGLTELEIEEYRHLADLHHGLMLLRYGSSRLYPYLMTRVDIVPILLSDLPFHSLFRGSTVGGEHCHYLHQCQYYAHSSRGGGWNKEDPILSIFKWTYRRLRERIEDGQSCVKEGFDKFVKQCFDESRSDAETNQDPDPPGTDCIQQDIETDVSESQTAMRQGIIMINQYCSNISYDVVIQTF